MKKEVKGKADKINELILKEDQLTYNSHPWIMFSLKLLVFIWREAGSFEIGRPRSRGWKHFERRWTMGVGDLENWTIFMDVICVSSLKVKLK